MLTEIHIRDLATIEELHLHLQHGCSMITGETGAGKSIFIEAIELALGSRGSSAVVRQGKEKADISLSFDITHFPLVIHYLQQMDLYQDNHPECIIRRIITHDGRSKSYVNGFPSTLQTVKQLGELLFHLHGQYEQQVLLKSETQREMLDRYADHLALSMQVKELALKWRTLNQEIKEIHEKSQAKSQRSDYLRFQLDEFEELNLQPGEWEKLEVEHHRLNHAEELISHLQQAQAFLSDHENQTILSLLNSLRKTLEGIQHLEPKTKEWLNNIHLASIHLMDIESELKHYLQAMELDPATLKAIEERVSQLYNLSRKHKISPQALCDFQKNLQAEFESLEACDDNLKKLAEQQKLVAAQYHTLAQQLTNSRKSAALKLEKEITSTIRSLSLPHGEFHILLEAECSPLSLHGNEKIIFLIKTNPDQTLQPLAKVISGGELSRLSLAAHLALANRTSIPTLVFDEVDTGLSGATAEKIGKLLRKLGGSYQVFCVSHQPQVAAYGHHHVLVEKYFVEKITHTRLRLLTLEEKTREIARMLGGEKMTEKTLEHAREVLASI